MPADLLRPRSTPASRLFYGLLGLLVVGVAVLLGAGVAAEARPAAVRLWALFAGGILAAAAPHVLLPDPDLHAMPHFNPPPRALARRGLRRWLPLMGLVALPVFVFAFFDPAAPAAALALKALAAFEGTLLVAAAGLYAFYRFMRIGTLSQAWQEGRKGGAYRALAEHSTTGRAPVPYGLVPAISATGGVFLLPALGWGLATLLARAGLSLWAPFPALLALAFALLMLRGLVATFDRHFYQTNGFYDELFRRAGSVRAEARDPLPYAAVYWVPAWLKPHAWMLLRQLDRRLPLGRVVLIGHVLFWLLVFREASADAVAAYLLLFSAAKNASVFGTATDRLLPLPVAPTYASERAWALVRFFVNLRWTLPWALSLGVVALLSDALTLPAALAWTLLDVALAAVTAGAATLFRERRHRRAYA